MSLRKTVIQSYENQCRLFQGNAEEILDSNFKMLRHLMVIAMIVLTFCLIVSIVGTDYAQRRPAYIISFACCLALCFIFMLKRFRKYALAGLYCIFGIFLGLTIFLSVVVSPTVMATSIIGLFCLMPPAILDKSWRIDLFMLLFLGIHLVLSWMMKTHNAASDDALNGLVFVLIGTMFGEYMRNIKLENYEMKRQAKIQMDVDFLTGLYNRRKMFELLERQKSSDMERRVTGFIMLDIDHFKEYNDHFGHLTGDDCLRNLSGAMREFGEQHRMEFFRYGGEEFLAFCYEEDTGISGLAEEIRQMVWELDIPYPGSEADRVTVSLGFAAAVQNSGNINDQLIMMADKALYRAKETGRNRVVSFAA